MAVRKKAGSKSRKTAGKTTMRKTMNQFATAARRKTKKLSRDAESAVEDAGEWAQDQAANVGGAIKRNPVMTIAIGALIGLAGWFAGRRALSD